VITVGYSAISPMDVHFVR